MEKNTTRISIRHSNVQLHSLVDGVINSGLNARLDGLPISIKGFFLKKWIFSEKFVQANFFLNPGLFISGHMAENEAVARGEGIWQCHGCH